MPATHVVPIINDARVYVVNKNGVLKHAHILTRRGEEVYVHYPDMDKRMDEWLPESSCTLLHEHPELTRKRSTRPHATHNSEGSSANGASMDVDPISGGETPLLDYGEGSSVPQEVVMTEEEFDMKQHQQLHTQKNFDVVIFDTWKIKPWYFSPYPLSESETEELNSQPGPKIPGVARTTARSHGRTSDILAGGLQRQHVGESMLWVCHFCFKYMVDGIPWELHKKDCKMKHPPGRKVYQRGAHTIWEVDGSREKLYCQSLSLFGKLFIDVKTLFFDCDNFLFYILTDAKSSEDHILGFFSKEKLSYDDYNLACIMTLPQYQRKGYGMLLIEFSYELSRREGKVGSPERPLSDLGLRSYLAYWTSTIIRFLRRVLSVLPPGVVSVRNSSEFPTLGEESYVSGDVERVELKTKKKKTKGFDGEVVETNVEQKLGVMPMKNITDPLFTTHRIYETQPRSDGGAETHVRVKCTLEDIARATNIRPDDAAFALNECGLLMRRMRKLKDGPRPRANSATNGNGSNGTGSRAQSGRSSQTPGPYPPSGVSTPGHENGIPQGNGFAQENGRATNGNGEGDYEDDDEETIVITRDMVENVAKERNVKIMYLDLSCVLI